ncbi:nicotinamide n-methyltransferase [Pseudogymnoascus destructans]|uniref:Protein N-terminal and lysine N-methyltransferase EFM7 n=1 Tax=Pseudogymnoascus destructans TaxID=655981 RepID=A0A177AM92_9PEZI|nr:nicotinamide n-methyltransferase [Pseudogymnoascus destructans]OAF62403.2 nicotinamide n-methyltransferase [Pseudogymnoascus destructans]
MVQYSSGCGWWSEVPIRTVMYVQVQGTDTPPSNKQPLALSITEAARDITSHRQILAYLLQKNSARIGKRTAIYTPIRNIYRQISNSRRRGSYSPSELTRVYRKPVPPTPPLRHHHALLRLRRRHPRSLRRPPRLLPPSPPPTTLSYPTPAGDLTLRLVGHNPLWGHHLWNGARVVSTYLETTPSLVAGKTVLELGAGAGLPSLVAGRLGAKRVVVTDYPDNSLIENLRWNIEHCDGAGEVVAEGYLWGADSSPLVAHLPVEEGEKFDILILADLLFNHSEHAKLIASVVEMLKRDGKALVFFTPYRPWLFEADMAFFEGARGAGLRVEKVSEEKMERVMFEEDRGDEDVRKTVFGYVLTWPEEGKAE